MLGALIPPEVIRRQLGTVQVLALFKVQGSDQVVGGKVTLGTVKLDTKVKVVRGNQTIGFGDMVGLQSGKQEATEVAMGTEAGLRLKMNLPIKVGDILEVFQEEVNRRPIDSHLR